MNSLILIIVVSLKFMGTNFTVAEIIFWPPDNYMQFDTFPNFCHPISFWEPTKPCNDVFYDEQFIPDYDETTNFVAVIIMIVVLLLKIK
jgi:hypothetical protein